MGPIEKALGPLVGTSLQYMMMDSWEAGIQNWTDDMIAQFRNRRGYDPTSYLPALAGRVVGGADRSDRFLWDFRRTIVDLIAEAHYGTMADLHKKWFGTDPAEGSAALTPRPGWGEPGFDGYVEDDHKPGCA